jgi:mono/diheme cytochrome c family protein
LRLRASEEFRPMPAKDAIRHSKLTALLLTLLVLALALPFAATPSAQTSAPRDDVQPRTPGLDPWNQPAGNLPQWDLRQAPPPLQPRAKRHLEFIQAGVPLEYRSLRSPYPQTPKVIAEGGALYATHCAGCHGAEGRGDGDAALDLQPSPALLARLMDAQGSVDEYLMWTIAEGGAPFDTAMPGFKSRLTENQIWQIVGYMRAGFPKAAQ